MRPPRWSRDWGEAKKAEIVQLKKRNLIFEGRVQRWWSQALFSDTQCQNKRWAQTERQEVLFKHQEKLQVQLIEDSTECPESLCLPSWRSSKNTYIRFSATSSRWPCFGRGWDQMPFRGSCQLFQSSVNPTSHLLILLTFTTTFRDLLQITVRVAFWVWQ